MRLTDDRIGFLSHQIIKSLVRQGLITTTDEAGVSQEIKKLMTKYLQHEEAIHKKIEAKIASIKRNIPEGSREWDILYEQYYNEEMGKMVR